MEPDLSALAARIARTAARVSAVAEAGGAASSELGMVSLAVELEALSAAALRLSVQRARNAGHTWHELGGLLGVTRQAAFQRFRPRGSRPAESVEPGELVEFAESIDEG